MIKDIIVTRWDKMTIPLHCLGFALSPKYYDKNYLEKLAPGGMERRPLNEDKEVILGVLKAFERILESDEEEKQLREEFAIFHMKKGIYSLPGTQADAVTLDEIDWVGDIWSGDSESYKSGPNKKWDMNPKSDYIERSNARLEEILWGDLDGECLENERGKCSELSIDVSLLVLA
uniref:Uncharacterized protein n=1 Tax=Lactuca sativa TaxID=4236 RepID=A0A9R1XCW7_LACSA|nr:hypothetical protein LSAT_V11C400182520 [Lactuca sativa]